MGATSYLCKANGMGALSRDHEPCERRVALRQHAAVSPRRGLRRCLACRVSTAAPCGVRRPQDTKAGLKPGTK